MPARNELDEMMDRPMEQLLADTEVQEEEEYSPTYRVVGSAKIPVSKSTGHLWKTRKESIEKSRKKADSAAQAWDDAIKYYLNDQMHHRSGEMDSAANVSVNKTGVHTTTENVVFSNITTIIPALYAKNPDCEITAVNPEQEESAKVLEKLVNTLAARRYNGGFNLKPKVRRAVMMACLTNRAYLEVRYIKREHSNEAHLADIEKLSEELVKAKTPAELIQLEGELQALEDTSAVLQPAGPAVTYRAPHHVYVDPNALEDDLSDAKWVMCCEYLPTSFIYAQYAKKNDDGSYEAIYDATHELVSNVDENATLSESFELLRDNDEYKGSIDKKYDKNLYTKVWYVWDKTTRRVFLFSDSNWKWPLWVWDDPYHLEGFFPFVALSFYQHPFGGESKGEVTYYLDQQDNINEINSAKQQALNALRRKIVYNSRMLNQEQIMELINESSESATGVALPEGAKLSDAILTLVPPAIQFPQLFDKGDQYNAIARISSTKTAMTGEQYRTNTTNEAIADYNQSSDIRIEEKTDLIEDMIGDVCWKIAQMCLQFMDNEQVATILGSTAAQTWTNLDAAQIRASFSLSVIGGSSTKPTSGAKKRMAMELGQVLGQFAGKLPSVGVVMLKVLERAFDEVIITDDEWKMINDSAEKAMLGESEVAKMDQMLQQMPENARMAFAQSVAQGAPIQQAMEQIVQQLKSNQPKEQ